MIYYGMWCYYLYNVTHINCWAAMICLALYIKETLYREMMYTVSGKNRATLFLPLTLSNAGQFSKFFHQRT